MTSVNRLYRFAEDWKNAAYEPERNYKQQLKVYESQTRAAGLYRMHPLGFL